MKSHYKISIFILFFLVGALTLGWLSNRYKIEEQKNQNILDFINKGKRFTAADGQELCERIIVLEKKAGIASFPCNFEKE